MKALLASDFMINMITKQLIFNGMHVLLLFSMEISISDKKTLSNSVSNKTSGV